MRKLNFREFNSLANFTQLAQSRTEIQALVLSDFINSMSKA